MKTMADFKRELISGSKVELLNLANNAPDNARLYRGMVREVLSTNTTGFYATMATGGDSFMYWGKASDWVFTGDTATNQCGLSYRIIGAHND